MTAAQASRSLRRATPVALPLASRLTLQVPVDAASLVTIRHVAGGLATALGFDAAGVADIRLALNEVCSAALRTSPGVGPAPTLGIELVGQGDRLLATVRAPTQHGAAGMTPLPLPLVAALTDTVELRSVAGGATETAMTFVRV